MFSIVFHYFTCWIYCIQWMVDMVYMMMSRHKSYLTWLRRAATNYKSLTHPFEKKCHKVCNFCLLLTFWLLGFLQLAGWTNSGSVKISIVLKNYSWPFCFSSFSPFFLFLFGQFVVADKVMYPTGVDLLCDNNIQRHFCSLFFSCYGF